MAALVGYFCGLEIMIILAEPFCGLGNYGDWKGICRYDCGY